MQFVGTKLLHNFSLENKKPPAGLRPPGDHWSGEATRTQGFAVEETRVDVMIGDDAVKDQTSVRKERPIWMTESTIITQDAVMVRIQIGLLVFSSLLHKEEFCYDLFLL
jgi:hypothetical protein